MKKVGSDSLVDENCYSKTVKLTYQTILNNLCIRLYYPKWDGDDKTIKNYSGMVDDDFVKTHLEQLDDLKNVITKLSRHEINKYARVKPKIENKARNDFKEAVENELTSLYNEYKEKFNPDEPWNYAVSNRYMETYDKIFGCEALMAVLAVRSFKADYEAYIKKDFSKKTVLEAKPTNINQKGLLSKFVQSSIGFVDASTKETDMNLNRSEISAKS